MADLTDVFPEGIGHSTLMCCRCIAPTLRHDCPFIEAPGCSDGCEVDIVGVDSCLKEGVGHVHLPEDLPFSTVGKDVIDAG
jgi:hypothetical protein